MRNVLILFSMLSLSLSAQTVVVKGEVRNVEDHLPIPGVHVSLDSAKRNVGVSNNRGQFAFKAKIRKGQSVYLLHTSFETLDFEITKRHMASIQNDTLDLGSIEMSFGNRIFGPVEVSSEKIPETVFGSEKFSVEDFELIDNDRILMLVYEKTLKRASELILTDASQKIITSYFIPGQAKELVHDFRNQVYLKTEDKIFHVRVNQNDMIQLTELDMKAFREQLEPIEDSLYEDVYFSDFSEIYPKFSYFEYDREDTLYTEIRTIMDQVMMDMYRAEFKYVDVRTKIWAHNLQNETGIDKEDIVGASIFTQSIYYDPLYAPMYLKNDTIYVFDFYRDFMYKFVSDQGVLDSVGVYFHHQPKKRGWENHMTQDLINDEIYGVFNRFGFTYIKPINLNTGATDGVFKLYYRYVEKIIVSDNYVYYTYRPFESTQKKFIYREKIPNEVLIKKTTMDYLVEE
ncbi:MAG: hypothetical protein KDC84_09240 [Crocinitomicaceae bacterium]|nr:hypothetical protein [Crocinitomicaceae bacterium]